MSFNLQSLIRSPGGILRQCKQPLAPRQQLAGRAARGRGRGRGRGARAQGAGGARGAAARVAAPAHADAAPAAPSC